MPKGYYDAVFLTSEPKWLRFIPGEYETKLYIPEEDDFETITLPFYHWRRHYDFSQKRFFPCSAGPEPDFDPKPCIGCSKDLNPQDAYSFTVIDLAWYHMVPWEKNNEIQVNKQTGKPIMVPRLCEGRGCPMCLAEAEKVFGMKRHLTVGYSQRNFLDQRVDQVAGYCTCGKKLDLAKLVCPKCEQEMIDFSDESISEKQIIEARRNGLVCKTCKRNMHPLDVLDCECGNPSPVSLYDVDVSVANIKTGEKQYTLQVDFSKPGPIDEKYKGDTSPYDFSKLFAPLSIEAQKILYKYNGPVTNVAEDTQTESYGE